MKTARETGRIPGCVEFDESNSRRDAVSEIGLDQLDDGAGHDVRHFARVTGGGGWIGGGSRSRLLGASAHLGDEGLEIVVAARALVLVELLAVANPEQRRVALNLERVAQAAVQRAVHLGDRDAGVLLQRLR